MNQKTARAQALIIDDEPDICYLLGEILRQKNIDSSYATTLSEGEKMLQNFEFPLVFLDNHLMDTLAIDHVRRLKTEYPFIKIVMITAYDTVADRQKATAEGADFFIGKPFNREIINKILHDFFFAP